MGDRLIKNCLPKSASRERIAKEAELLTGDQVSAVHEALKFLADRDSDHAQFLNGIGFSGIDVVIGHSLAEAYSLSAKQAALGKRIVLRYKNTQLPQELAARIIG